MEDSSCFFKIIFSAEIQELRIPEAFAKKYRRTLQTHAYLRAPGGEDHQVKLTRHDGGDWFSDGWKDFSDQYSLKPGYFLVFRYRGHSYFHVLIFDTSCSEIDYPNIDVRSSDEELEDSKQGKSDARKKAEELALTLRNPNFVVNMAASYLTGEDIRMWVPLAYAREYLEGINEVQVQVEVGSSEKTWNMKVATTSNSTRFASGWKPFMSNNRLEVGDVCVFELTDSSNHTYLVRIFRGDEVS